MAKISANPLLLLIRKRCYTVAAENGRVGAAETVVRKVVEERKEKEFWMRDPKSGNWIPENHFGDTDVADLRNKYLSSNSHNNNNNKLINPAQT